MLKFYSCVLLALNILLSSIICVYFDERDIRKKNRIESLDADVVESLEGVLRTEDTENSQKIIHAHLVQARSGCTVVRILAKKKS